MKGGMTMKNVKQLKIGMYTAAVAAIAIVIAVLVNLLVGYIPAKYTKFDTSGLGLYEITKESEAILSEVDKEVTIYLIVEEGMEDAIVTGLIDQYVASNSNIKYAEVDPILHPTFETPCGKSYTLGDYSENTVIVAGPERDKVIEYTELFQTEYTEEEYYYYMYYGVEPVGTTSFYGEAKLTGAIGYVSGDDALVVYTLEGHGEAAFGTALSGYLSDDNYTTEPLSLLSAGNVPEDAGCLVINNPTADISAAEAKAISDYINAGGRVILVTSFNGNNVAAYANLCSLGAAFGVVPVDGMAVEGSSNHSMSGYPYYLLPDVGSHGITAPVADSYRVFTPYAHGLKINEDEIAGVTNTVLLTTSSSAYTTDGTTISQADALYSGQMYLGVMSEIAAKDDMQNGCFVWYSSYGITDDSADSYVSGGNSALFLSTLAYTCEKEESASIAAKSMAVELLQISDAASNTWSTVLTLLVPLAVIIPGFAYWIYRRKK